VLLVEQGSLYPALHRLEERGWISPYWGTSENNRRARFYKLTAKGRKELRAEASRWELLVEAVGRVMRPSDL
jgi:DNA-binding PadR family transcriptional regulator